MRSLIVILSVMKHTIFLSDIMLPIEKVVTEKYLHSYLKGHTTLIC